MPNSKLELQEIGKAIFVNPTWPIWAFSSLILAYWTRVRMQIDHLAAYE